MGALNTYISVSVNNNSNYNYSSYIRIGSIISEVSVETVIGHCMLVNKIDGWLRFMVHLLLCFCWCQLALLSLSRSTSHYAPMV